MCAYKIDFSNAPSLLASLLAPDSPSDVSFLLSPKTKSSRLSVADRLLERIGQLLSYGETRWETSFVCNLCSVFCRFLEMPPRKRRQRA